MSVVADTGPLNYLILIEAVNVLPQLYTGIVIPQTVAVELTDRGAPQPVRRWIAQAHASLNVVPDPPADETLHNLDPGERAAIALAHALSASRLLIDDSDGRTEAARRGLKVTGTLGVLAAAHRNGLVDFDTAIERLSRTSFYLSPRLIATARRLLSAAESG